MANKRFKISLEWQLDFFTSCPKINCNPLLSLQSRTSSSKYRFYLVLWNLFIKSIRVFGGIWQYHNVEIKNNNFYDQP